jgi:hypothetical protein
MVGKSQVFSVLLLLIKITRVNKSTSFDKLYKNRSEADTCRIILYN